jgi:hypothetical protein
MLDRNGDGRYSNTPVTATYLNRREGDFLGGMFDQFNTREYVMWNTLSDALRTGEPRTEIDAAEHFTALYRDPARFRTFVGAMTASSLPAAKSIAARFPWTDYRTLMDIGTSQGCLPVQVAHAHNLGRRLRLAGAGRGFRRARAGASCCRARPVPSRKFLS